MKLHVESLLYEQAPFRTPLTFGSSRVTELTIPHVRVRLSGGRKEAEGVGAMPLGNAWAFPLVPHEQSLAAMRTLTDRLAVAANGLDGGPSPLDLSHRLEGLALQEAARLAPPLPKLAVLVVFSVFDIALFDAWGRMHQANTYLLLRESPAGRDLSHWLDDGFRPFGLIHVIRSCPVESLPVVHLVGGADPLTPSEVRQPVGDGLPEHLEAWIERDQLTHFKIKLRGEDPDWDYQRIVAVERVVAGKVRGEAVFSLDFNEKCKSGATLAGLLRRLQRDAPRAFEQIAYIEQPTPRELRDRPEDRLHEAARLKPVVIDEALTDYDAYQRARELGYSGVALKACKGIGPSLLMAAACRRDNLFLCVQDLTCPGLALLASLGLAAWLGVPSFEANARQFCPRANEEYARKRPDLFVVRGGRVRTVGLAGDGLGFGN